MRNKKRNVGQAASLEYLITDAGSGRKFCLMIHRGELLCLKEQVLSHPSSVVRIWNPVPTSTLDGQGWWELWRAYVKAGFAEEGDVR